MNSHEKGLRQEPKKVWEVPELVIREIDEITENVNVTGNDGITLS